MKSKYASEIQEQYLNKIRKHALAYIGGTSKFYEYLRRSGEMANTLPLKGNEESPLAGSSPASGITCKCGHELYTHRGNNGECYGRDLNVPLTYRQVFDRIICSTVMLVNWSDPSIWCKCKKYESQSNEKDR